MLVPRAGVTTDMFASNELDNNGDQFLANSTLAGEELNMRVTVQPSG